MANTAQRTNGVRVQNFYDFDGAKWIEVACADYDALRKLPEVLNFCGNLYARTGWDSDKCKAYYNTRAAIAFPRYR